MIKCLFDGALLGFKVPVDIHPYKCHAHLKHQNIIDNINSKIIANQMVTGLRANAIMIEDGKDDETKAT